MKKYDLEIKNEQTKVDSLIINNQDSLDNANETLKSIKRLQKEINSTFDPIITKAHEAHKEAILQKRKYIDPLNESEKIIKNKMVQYSKILECENERKRKEIEEIARQEKEKVFIKINSDIDILVSDCTDIESKIKKIEEKIDNADVTEEIYMLMLDRIEVYKLQLKGKEKEALELQSKAQQVNNINVDIKEEKIKSKGLIIKKIKKPVIVDKIKILQDIIKGKISVNIIIFDMVKIKKLIDADVVIDGVEIEIETNVSSRI